MIAIRREETGVLVMKLSENLWPEDLELSIPAVHDIARSPQNPLLLLVVANSDFDTPLWDVSRSNIAAGNFSAESPFQSGSADTNPAEPKNNLNSEVQMQFFGPNQECEARAWLLSFATPHCLPPILG